MIKYPADVIYIAFNKFHLAIWCYMDIRWKAIYLWSPNEISGAKEQGNHDIIISTPIIQFCRMVNITSKNIDTITRQIINAPKVHIEMAILVISNGNMV